MLSHWMETVNNQNILEEIINNYNNYIKDDYDKNRINDEIMCLNEKINSFFVNQKEI